VIAAGKMSAFTQLEPLAKMTRPFNSTVTGGLLRVTGNPAGCFHAPSCMTSRTRLSPTGRRYVSPPAPVTSSV